MKGKLPHSAAVLTAIALFALGASAASHAQPPARKDFYWLNVGVGGTSFGGAYGAGLSAQYGMHLLSFHCAGAYNVESSEVGSEYSVLYGLGRRGGNSAYSLAVGAGVMHGNHHHGDFLFDFDPVWGFSTEAQLFGRISEYFGLGLSAFLNLNREKDFPVILLSVQFGRLWRLPESGNEP